MSMRTLLSEVRTALTGYSGLTDLIPASKITFALRPQRDKLPGLIYEIGVVDYDETVQSFAAATTYRVDITAYGRSADETTNIHDQIKLALLAASSQNFRIRILDERYVVDVDNNHMCQVQATWQLNSGITNNQTTILSPSWQGFDVMKIQYVMNLTNGMDATDLASNQQAYYFEYRSSQGSADHTVNFPEAQEGKIITIITGQNVDSNTLVSLYPATGDQIEGGNKYQMNRGASSATFVCIDEAHGSRAPRYNWRILWYQGLHA